MQKLTENLNHFTSQFSKIMLKIIPFVEGITILGGSILSIIFIISYMFIHHQPFNQILIYGLIVIWLKVGLVFVLCKLGQLMYRAAINIIASQRK